MISQSFFNNPARLKRCTGLTIDQFNTLCQLIEPLWQEAERKRLSYPNRQRAIGAGHPYKLKTIKEKVFCILLWYKLYPAFWFLGMLVGIDASNAYRLVSRLRPLIKRAADCSLGAYLKRTTRKIKKGRKKISSWEDLEKEFPEIAKIFVDVTEQQRQRPKRKVQKKYYSGKKKRHTLKTQLMVNNQGRILDVSKTYPGSIHDFAILRKEGTPEHIPKEAKGYLDRGYQGVSKEYPNHHFLTPVKKNRWKRKLARSEKIYNTKLARKRVIVEHVISRLKKYGFLAQVFRGRRKRYNQDFKNIAAIVNFRLALAT